MYKKQKGMLLLEVVVAMLVVGLGISMSIAMMQLSSKHAETAGFRTIALYQIKDIISRMRANSLVAENYEFGTDNYDTWSRKDLGGHTDCTLGCSPDAIRQNDLNEWLDNVATMLPGGRASILKQQLKLPQSEYVALIMWRTTIQNDDNKTNTQSTEEDSIQVRFTL